MKIMCSLVFIEIQKTLNSAIYRSVNTQTKALSENGERKSFLPFKKYVNLLIVRLFCQ